MENLIPILIVIGVVIYKVVKAVQEQQGENGGGGDGWWEEEGDSSPSQPKTTPTRQTPTRQTPPQPAPAKARPQPSTHVQQILRQLQEQGQGRQAAPEPKPTPQPRPQVAAVQERPQRRSQPTRQYLDEGQVEAELVRKARADADAATADVYKQSVAAGFPAVMTKTRRGAQAASKRPAIHVRARGRRDLRQTILLAEALGPPRAFDV
jgi:hypothetical protein